MSKQYLSKNKKRKEARKQDKLVNTFLTSRLTDLGLPGAILSSDLNLDFAQSVCNDHDQLINKKNTEASVEDFNI